jgi:hypothetical protein
LRPAENSFLWALIHEIGAIRRRNSSKTNSLILLTGKIVLFARTVSQHDKNSTRATALSRNEAAVAI